MFQKALALHPLGLRDRIARVDQFSWNSPASPNIGDPVCLAGETHHLIGLSVQKSLGLASFPSVTHSLVAILRPGGEPLTDGIREQLWRAFGVPVFAVLMDDHENILARECLAADGLHCSPDTRWERESSGMLRYRLRHRLLPSPRAASLMMSGRIVQEPCDCGKPGARIVLERSIGVSTMDLPFAIATAASAR